MREPPVSTLALFRNEADTKSVDAGETIFVEGEEGRLMFVVLEGSVRLSVTGRTLDKVGPGGVFGEMALIDSAPRSATATALTACTLVPVTAQRFKSLVKESPEFALEIMGVMASRLRSMDRRL
jgi:CRP/FNR family transcriptional regulator, cyclic AMP receptor protein